MFKSGFDCQMSVANSNEHLMSLKSYLNLNFLLSNTFDFVEKSTAKSGIA